jgi:hypothetical protein
MPLFAIKARPETPDSAEPDLWGTPGLDLIDVFASRLTPLMLSVKLGISRISPCSRWKRYSTSRVSQLALCRSFVCCSQFAELPVVQYISRMAGMLPSPRRGRWSLADSYGKTYLYLVEQSLWLDTHAHD